MTRRMRMESSVTARGEHGSVVIHRKGVSWAARRGRNRAILAEELIHFAIWSSHSRLP